MQANLEGELASAKTQVAYFKKQEEDRAFETASVLRQRDSARKNLSEALKVSSKEFDTARAALRDAVRRGQIAIIAGGVVSGVAGFVSGALLFS